MRSLMIYYIVDIFSSPARMRNPFSCLFSVLLSSRPAFFAIHVDVNSLDIHASTWPVIFALRAFYNSSASIILMLVDQVAAVAVLDLLDVVDLVWL